MKVLRSFLARVRQNGVKRREVVVAVAMGRERTFEAWDMGDDTFIFESGIATRLDERPSVLIVNKASLRAHARGNVMTITTGNHSVAAFPLLDGRFWKLSRVSKKKRGFVLTHNILCANVIDDTIEISQREVNSKKLFRFDSWLLDTLGFSLKDIVLIERNDATLDHYRQLGQEWRVKPLAWTEPEMKVALDAAKKRIATKINYFHSMRGVHFLTFPEFKKFSALSQTNPEAFVKALKELVSIYENNTCSFTRLLKHRGHHEIEFFGIARGEALKQLVPELEQLMEAIVLGRIGQLGVIQKIEEITSLYKSILIEPELADDTSSEFINNLYMHITGEVYSISSEGVAPAFDDRRTALPGATFVAGRPIFHPGADDRTEILLSNIRGLMSKEEIVEYANVYELRGQGDENIPTGQGRTREVVYKTNRSPLEQSKIVKSLSRSTKGYASYVLARIEAFKALGIALSDYRILQRRAFGGGKKRFTDYFVRNRLEGEPIDSIPSKYFSSVEDSSVEESDVVLALAMLMGDAAAQNMTMKKYDPTTSSPNFGVGKEIYEFEYSILAGRIIPKRVATCSIRGSFGWPCLDEDDKNLNNIMNFYLTYYAHALKIYQKKHSNVSMRELAERFLEGFEFRMHQMEWQLSVLRDQFEAFHPGLPSHFGFEKKWRFVLWSLERQERRLPILHKLFLKKVALEENEEPLLVKNNAEDDDEIEIVE